MPTASRDEQHAKAVIATILEHAYPEYCQANPDAPRDIILVIADSGREAEGAVMSLEKFFDYCCEKPKDLLPDDLVDAIVSAAATPGFFTALYTTPTGTYVFSIKHPDEAEVWFANALFPGISRATEYIQ